MRKGTGFRNRFTRGGRTIGISESLRQEMINKLNTVNIFVDSAGRELQASPYGEVKRTYSLYLIRNGLQPDGHPE